MLPNTTRETNSKFDLTDITQAVIWHEEDYDKVKQYFEIIRDYKQRRDKRLPKLIDCVDERIERFKNDQTIIEGPKPIEVVEKKDLVVAAGRTRCAELITGYSFETFDNMAVGTSQIPPQDSDFKLYEEVGRVSHHNKLVLYLRQVQS